MVEEAHVPPDDYLCPITHQLMKNPVVAADGFTYERSAISLWLKQGHHRSPVTNQRLAHNSLTPNSTLKRMIDKFWRELPLIQRENQVEVNIEEAVKFKEKVKKQAVEINNQHINRIENELNEEKNKVERLASQIEELKQRISENSTKILPQKTSEPSIVKQYPNTRSIKSSDKLKSQSKPYKRAKKSLIRSLNFKSLEGQKFSILIEESATIAEVKNKIFDQEGFPYADQKLIFGGKELADQEKISDINLQDDSMIIIENKKKINENQGSENYLIHVKTLQGHMIECTMNLADTVDNLKAKIQESWEIPPDAQRLMFQGKQLLDDGGPSLASYGVCDQSVIYVILRLAGC